MNDSAFLRQFGMCILVSGVAVGVIAAIGYFPTMRVASREGVVAMLAGCGVSFVASCAGSACVVYAVSGPISKRGLGVLTSTGVRFLTVLALVVPLVFSGLLHRKVFVLWVAVSYLVLLMIDTAWAVRLLNREPKNET